MYQTAETTPRGLIRAALPQIQQRAAIAAAARLVAAHRASGAAARIALLPFFIIDASLEIEPDNRIVRTMPLGLRFITKRISAVLQTH
jgi:hypothetical protein